MERNRVAAVLGGLALGLLASSGGRAGEIVSQRAEMASAPASIEVRSSAFSANAPIPDRYSAYHENQSPPLEWSGAPERTQAVALVVEDPDAPGARPFVHWLVAAVPARVHALPESLPDSPTLRAVGDAHQGATSLGHTGWFGPRPPPGGPHHYHFQVFALDAPVELSPGFDRDALVTAMKGHVLARGDLVATYRRALDAAR
ncbi:MAG TPA: YbhB/YbcL family Raf kinase inhibitor-like protein [Myxococcota bacterium]|nr:YbhB/YbcL family Raf kinase inhibitor-like protein [Myxococcota bacterium]